METWDVTNLDLEPQRPQVLASYDEGRVIAIALRAGESLLEHQVHERTWLVVVSGALEIADAGGGAITAGPGTLAAFEPNERREVRATDDSRLLLALSPWPGVGHPSQRSAS